jgi:hypothetical protein
MDKNKEKGKEENTEKKKEKEKGQEKDMDIGFGLDNEKDCKINNKNGYGSNDCKENKTDEIQRITVSKSGQDALTAIVERVNDGFIGGKINRTQAANWIMMRFNDNVTDTEIREIRADHFDEIAVLEAILRKAKESGKVPSEFKALLQKQLEITEQPKKKIKKALTDFTINDVL